MKQRGLRVVIATVAIVFICGALFLPLVIKNERFQHFVIGKIIKAVDEATGGKMELRAVDFKISTLTASLHGITIRGREPAGSQPLLQVETLTVGFKLQFVSRRKITLSELTVYRPVVRLLVGRDGASNVPRTSEPHANSKRNIFDLAVRHVLINQGEINYNNHSVPLEADLYGLNANVHFDPTESRYGGDISYTRGDIQYAQYATLAHSFHASFRATPEELWIDNALLTVGSSSATVSLNLAHYSDPVIDGTYDIHITAGDVSRLMSSVKPDGDLRLTGKLHVADIGKQPLQRVLVVQGEFSSATLSASVAAGLIELRNLRGWYGLANGSFEARDVYAESLGGTIRASLNVRHIDATPIGRVQVLLRGLTLQAIQRSVRRPDPRRVNLLGMVDGVSQATWTGSIQTIRVNSDVFLRGVARAAKTKAVVATSNAPIGNLAVSSAPVGGVIHLIYDGSRDTLSLRPSTLHIPSVALTAHGEISDRSNLQVQAVLSDLHETATLANAFAMNSGTLPPISGSGTFTANIRGSLKSPEIAANVSAQNFNIQGSEWRSLQATVLAQSSRIRVVSSTLSDAHQGRATLSGSVALGNWSYQSSNPINASLSVQHLSVADFLRLFNEDYPVGGSVSAKIAIAGTQVDPQGSGTVQIANGEIYGEPVRNAGLDFRADGGSIKSSAKIELTAGTASADLVFTPTTKAYSVRFDAPAIVLQHFKIIQSKNLAVAGMLSATAAGNGTLDNPELHSVVTVTKLTLREQPLSDINAEVKVFDHKASFDLNSQVLHASVRSHGQVSLTDNYPAEATINTTAIPLEVLLAGYLPGLPQGFKGDTEVHAHLKGPLKTPAQLEAHLLIPVLQATYPPVQIGTKGAIRADYAHSVITLQPMEISGTGTSLHMSGSIPIAGSSASTFAAQGTVDMSIAQLFVPDIKSSGVVSLDLHTSGTIAHPNVNGQLRLQNIAVIEPSAPLSVEKLSGTLDVDDQRVHLNDVSGQLGGGELSVGGSIAYKPSLQFNVSMLAHSVRMRYPNGVRTSLDCNLALTGNKESSVMNGRVLIDSLSFTPDFDLAKFGDQFGGDSATPAQPGFADNIKLSIALQSQDSLKATSSQVSIGGRVNLHVGGTAASPIITGRTDLTSGELFYRNVRYQLQRGIITFEDPNQTSPVLNVSVTSTVEQYNLTLNLRGPFDKLTTSYVSDPPLATADIISLLATGQTTGQSSASQSTDSILASQAASQFSGSVQKLAGISSLQINPLIGSSNQNPSAQIAIQQRVTKNLLFTFSTDVSQPGSEIVQGEYQLTKRWSVSVARDEAGGVTAEGRLHTRF